MVEVGHPWGKENFWEMLMNYQGGEEKKAPTAPLPVTGQPQLLGVFAVWKMNFVRATGLLHLFPYMQNMMGTALKYLCML